MLLHKITESSILSRSTYNFNAIPLNISKCFLFFPGAGKVNYIKTMIKPLKLKQSGSATWRVMEENTAGKQAWVKLETQAQENSSDLSLRDTGPTGHPLGQRKNWHCRSDVPLAYWSKCRTDQQSKSNCELMRVHFSIIWKGDPKYTPK